VPIPKQGYAQSRKRQQHFHCKRGTVLFPWTLNAERRNAEREKNQQPHTSFLRRPRILRYGRTGASDKTRHLPSAAPKSSPKRNPPLPKQTFSRSLGNHLASSPSIRKHFDIERYLLLRLVFEAAALFWVIVPFVVVGPPQRLRFVVERVGHGAAQS
jgi:hypothetical protein